MSSLLRTVKDSSWSQRLVALVLGGNIILILWGLYLVPAIFYPDGLGTTVAAILMQLAIACLVFFGLLSFSHYRASTIPISLVLALLFAFAYDGILLTDFVPSINIDFNVFLLFLGAAGLAGFLAGYRSRSFWSGVVAAFWALVIGTAIWSIGLMLMNYGFWGSHQWFLFWKNDGAIDDFHHSGFTNMHLFILQDMQAALFFHPLLSAVVGAICGVVTSGLAQVILWLRQRLAYRPAT